MYRNRVSHCESRNGEGSLGEFGAGARNGANVGAVGGGM